MTEEYGELGRLEPVDLRTIWAHEAHSFTPWLLSNGDRLSEALGIELELSHREHAVGGFSLDLIGRDLTHDAVLIVENQLETSDHSHLGQLITYAAGTDAATVVWVAPRIREEHRQALDWLNENTGEDLHFFGVEVEAVRIGDSVPAPLFKVIAQPNDWQKSVKAAAAAASSGGKGPLYAAFWEEYRARLQAEHPGWSRSRGTTLNNWFPTPSRLRGCQITAVFAANQRIRLELYIDRGSREECKSLFDALFAQRAAVEAAYGRSLEWERLDERKASRVAEYRSGDVARTDEHEEYIEFFLDAGARMRTALDAVAGE